MATTAPTLSLQPFPSVPFPLPVGWLVGSPEIQAVARVVANGTHALAC